MTDFTTKVLQIVSRIPYGQVASYGQVAVAAGVPRAARQVGWILNKQGTKPGIPWWRVINNSGRISIKHSEISAMEQRNLLWEEGVEVSDMYEVDINKYRANLNEMYNNVMVDINELHKPQQVQEIYNNLEIHPNLQEHMLQVASLAKIITDNWKGTPLNESSLTQACLFHDAAKLIKFKTFEENPQHWEEVRKKYITKYGEREHEATIAICKEAGVSDEAISLLEEKNVNPFIERARFLVNTNNFELKLLAYCDARIAPNGIATLQGRYEELLKRDSTKVEDREAMELFLELEEQIHEQTKMDLQSIRQEEVDEIKKNIRL